MHSTTNPPGLLNAVDRLLLRSNCDDTIGLLRGKRCGLVLNHTSVAHDGTPTLTVLENLGIDVSVLFSPEHGLQGVLEGHVGDASAHGRKVLSLYGETRRPTKEMLAGLDVLLFDIQDIGARFYTYSSTMALCLEACAESGVSMVVLDRANPLGGERIEGPLIDEELRSFIGHMRIPVVHGLTIGELARWHREDAQLDVDLHVVEVEGWNRTMTWPRLGRAWVPPSPNIPDFESADWYAGICLLEFNDVSVGRGTPHPFQILGAPWIDADALSAALEPYKSCLQVSWESITFTPSRATHEGRLCHGLKFSKDGQVPVVALGFALVSALHASHPEQYTAAMAEKGLSLLGSRQVLALLLEGDFAAARMLANGDAGTWRQRRAAALLY